MEVITNGSSQETFLLERKEKPCALTTVNRKVSFGRQFFAEALDRGLIEANPAARVRGYTVSQESATLGLTETQAKEVLASIETEALLELRDRAMLSLMLRTGIRRMDVIGATVGAVSERDGHTVLRVVGKRNKERLVKIPVEVTRQLAARREGARAFREERPTTPPLLCAVLCAGPRGPY